MVLAAVCGQVRAEEAHPGRRVALVIGNGDYRSVDKLRNSTNDARLIASTLKDLGFTLIGDGPKLNLNREAMTQAVQEFGRALPGAEVALFYYSGHGLQVQGLNWLVPVDANPTRAQDLEFQMVDADLVLHQMDGVGTRLNIVILDACRNNPFAIRGLRALGGGLAEMRAPEGTLISYATQPGSVARDGDGADSPYSTALAKTLRQPGLDVFRTFNQVGLAVKRETGGEQQPWVSNSPIDGDFSFAGPVPPPAPAPQTAALVRPPAVAVAPPSASPRGVAPCVAAGQRAILPAPPDQVESPDAGCASVPAARAPAGVAPRPPPRRPTPVATRSPARSSHCGDLMARFQIGEPLSAAEQSALSGCR